jgi:hypothetical protein
LIYDAIFCVGKLLSELHIYEATICEDLVSLDGEARDFDWLVDRFLGLRNRQYLAHRLVETSVVWLGQSGLRSRVHGPATVDADVRIERLVRHHFTIQVLHEEIFAVTASWHVRHHTIWTWLRLLELF